MSNSVPQLYLDFVARNPSANFVHIPEKQDGKWRWIPMNREDSLLQVAGVTRKLDSLGVKKGDRVAIWANTRAEWCLIDLAVLSLGAVVVGIYPTLAKDIVFEQLRDSGASVLIVEKESQVLQWEDDFDELDSLIHLMSIEEGEELLSVGKDLGEEGDVAWLREQIAQRASEELASIIYTSGTTGKSKGVLLTHQNFTSNLESTKEVLPLPAGSRSLVCLPLGHSLQRFVVYRAFVEDIEGYFAPSLREIAVTIQAARPTILIAVPRMLEKIQNKIIQQARERSIIALLFVRWAISTGWKVQKMRANKEVISWRLRKKWHFLERIVVSKIRARLGGELTQIVSGGAPLNDETAKFFMAMGLQVIEGWGLSETCAPATLNMDGVRKIGSVGKVLSNMELKLTENSEILIKGQGVFSGYYGMDSEDYFQDGFFKTGDLGRIDEDGYLYITGRSKDIIVTAGGKNIAPQRIAQMVEGELIHHCIVIGNQQKYLVALIALEEDVLQGLASERGWSGGFRDWIQEKEVQNWIKERVDGANTQLAGFEQLKKYSVIQKPLTEDDGLLTSTQKLKKKAVIERYQALWQKLY